MKKLIFIAAFVFFHGICLAKPPSEIVIKSCLVGQGLTPSARVRIFNTSDIIQEDDYALGFNAAYIFKYQGVNIGCAEGKSEDAIIFSGKLYWLSRAVPAGNNHEIKPDRFDPMQADWSDVQTKDQHFLCVSFNFDGLGRSGNFQNIRGGYLLNRKTGNLYFSVRNVKK